MADLNVKGAHETAEKSKEFATHPNYRTVVVGVDVTDPASVKAMVDATVAEFGRIDYSVNCAGVNDSSRLRFNETMVKTDGPNG